MPESRSGDGRRVADRAGASVSRTFLEEDRKAAGQRRVNILWELTQSIMALSLTAAEIFMAINRIESKALDVAFVAVMTMYFIRTNHTKTGGVGGETAGPR